MGNERDDLKNIEDGKKGGLLTAVISVIGTVVAIGKVLVDISTQNEVNELRNEKNDIKRKIIKSSDDKKRIREIDDKIERLKK